MFNKPSQGGTSNEFETVIGPSVKVKGDFNAQGNVINEAIRIQRALTINPDFNGNRA